MSGMVRADALLILAAIGFWAIALFDFTRTDESEMRMFSKPMWLVLLVFTSLLGLLMWFFEGQPQRPSPRQYRS